MLSRARRDGAAHSLASRHESTSPPSRLRARRPCCHPADAAGDRPIDRLSRQADHDDRAVPARRRGRHHRRRSPRRWAATSSRRWWWRTRPARAAAWACSTCRARSRTATRSCMALSSISIIPEADKVLGRDPMYQLNQLVPIARFTADPTVLAVRADSPYKSVKDLVEAAKEIPARFPTARRATTGRCTCRWRCSTARPTSKMLHVPFTGAGPAVVALLGGQVEALSTGPSSVDGPHQGRQGARAGDVGRIAPSGAARRADAEGAGLRRAVLAVDRRSSCRPARPTHVIAKLREAREVRGRRP